MNASKEEARKAIEKFDRLTNLQVIPLGGDTLEIRDFLLAAERKLPSEAAYEADRNRRKTKLQKA